MPNIFRKILTFFNYKKLMEAQVLEAKEMLSQIERKNSLMDTANKIAATLLSARDDDKFEESLLKSFELVGSYLQMDRVQIWRNETIDGSLHFVNSYHWLSDVGKQLANVPIGLNFPYSAVPGWYEMFSSGACINTPLTELPPDQHQFLDHYGIQSIIIIPLFIKDEFWGFFSLDDCVKARTISEQKISILRSVGLMLSSSINRGLMLRDLRNESRKIEEQAHWYQSLLDGTPFPITVQDTEMRWVFVNKAAEGILGKSREEICGIPCYSWNLEICNTDNCAINCSKRGQKQTCFQHNGASYRVDVEELKDLDGKTSGFIEVVQDVTELETMSRLKAEAESRAKSAFLANMSHEMRTPMNAIIGMTELGKKAVTIERKDYALKKISNASVHLLGVINDILDMSKIEAQKMELSNVKFCFKTMIRNVTSIIQFHLDEKHQNFSVDIDEAIPRFVIGDDQHLAQIIVNLLTNAIKFTYEGGEIKLKATLLSEQNGMCKVQFEVVDQGIGISPEQQKKLFRAFEQADGGINREYGGSGLGLAISKGIVEMMDGDISVESELGKGARFIFTVNLERSVQNDNSTLNAADEEEMTPANQFAGKKLLLAEDIELNREIVISLLEDTGLAIDCAKNGAEAVAMIEAAPEDYDMVLMDIQMPVMDGVQATRKIRQMPQPHLKKLPIIAMTANVFKEDVDNYLAAGMNDHIGKPIDTGLVFRKLRHYLTA